jgi:SRSO17 transposase
MVLSPEDKQLARWQVEDIQERIGQFFEPFLARFTHSHQRLYAEVYVKGRFNTSSRRTSEPLAREAKVDHRKLQYFIGEGLWNDRVLRDFMRDKIAAEMGSQHGVLICDASAFAKAGTHSVGVQRQHNGRLGKIDNCQVGEFLAYASSGSVTLLDSELYMPAHWMEDDARRQACHVPDELEFKTGWELALEMVERHSAKLPHCAVVGDEAYGKVDAFRDGLRAIDERYLGEIPSNRLIRPLRDEKALHATALGERLLSAGYEEFVIREGEKGPVKVRAAKCRVAVKRATVDGVAQADVNEVFVVVRNTRDSKVWFYLGTDDRTTLKEWVRIGSCRTGIEYAFELAKGEAGLAEYEMRSFVGWHHHMTLSMMALWFLVMEQRWLKKKGFSLRHAKFDKLWPTSVKEFGREWR